MEPDTDEAVTGPAGDTAARRWRFPATPPMPTYVTHVSAGPYHVVRDECGGIALGIYCRQSLAEYLDPEEIFTTTKQGFDFFHSWFGIEYPFGKYDQLFVPEFKAGGMENAGAVTIMEDFVFRSRVTDNFREARGEAILHEMAHMWFGNLVTMRWWDDLWLNESFATWAAAVAQAEATRWTSAWTRFTQGQKAWAYRQDQLPSTHPIAADIPDIAAVAVSFDGITYAKGASVLKQLVTYVGKDNFLAGVRDYFTAHAWGPAGSAQGNFGPRPGRLVARVAGNRGREHAAARVHTRQRGPVHLLRGAAGSRRYPPGAAHAPDRDRPVLTHRRHADQDQTDRGRHRWGRHDGTGPHRRAPARPYPGQRRRPVVCEDPAG